VRLQVAERQVRHRLPRLRGGAADVRRQHHLRQRAQALGPITPRSSASIKADSSTTEPRATLTRMPLVPSAASTSALISLRVPAPPGVIRTRKSLSAASAVALGKYLNAKAAFGLREV
jgi:hypothetical protein